MPDPDKPAATGTARRLLRCNACERVDVCSPTELLQFTRTRWPTCCNAVMTLFIEAALSETDDTRLDCPKLPFG